MVWSEDVKNNESDTARLVDASKRQNKMMNQDVQMVCKRKYTARERGGNFLHLADFIG